MFHDDAGAYANLALNGANAIALKGTLEAAVLSSGTNDTVEATRGTLTWPGVVNGPLIAKPHTPSHNFSGINIEPGPEVEVIDPLTLYPEWVQSLGAHDAYPDGSIVVHSEKLWITTTAPNVWEPGVSGWREVVESGYPAWVQPTGAHDAYPLNAIVTHNGQVWESQYAANVWEPGVFGWVVYVP